MRKIPIFAFLAAISTDASLHAEIPTVPIRGVNSTVDMPLFGLGTWQYNSARAGHAIELAFGMGYRHVDTAYEYQNQEGVGLALKKTGLPRDQYFVTSKIPGGLNASATTEALDKCLSDLGLDYVDLMLIHYPAAWDGKGSPALRKEEWLALEAWAKKGKARSIGVSHYCRAHLDDTLSVNTVPVAVNQVQYHVGMANAGNRATDDKDYFEEKGVLYQSFSSLCGPCKPPHNKELLTGKLVTGIGAAHNKSGAQVSLRWLVQEGIPVIPKSDNPTHLKENMLLFDFELSAEEMALLNAAASPPVDDGPSDQDSGDCDIGEQSLFLAL